MAQRPETTQPSRDAFQLQAAEMLRRTMDVASLALLVAASVLLRRRATHYRAA
jgi:hypothetical protein